MRGDVKVIWVVVLVVLFWFSINLGMSVYQPSEEDGALEERPVEHPVEYIYVKTMVTLWVDSQNFTIVPTYFEQTRITQDGYKKSFRMGSNEFGANVKANVNCDWYASSEKYPDAFGFSKCRISFFGDKEMAYVEWWNPLATRSAVRLHALAGVYGDEPDAGTSIPQFPHFVTLFIREQNDRFFGSLVSWGGFYVTTEPVERCYEWIDRVWAVLEDPSVMRYRCHPIEVP